MSGYMSRYIGADRLPRNLSEFDIDVYFRLPEDMIKAIRDRFHADRMPGADNRMIALAAQVVFLRTTGRPMDNVSLLPVALLRHLGEVFKVSVPSLASLKSIYQRRATASQHQRWAREYLELSTADEPRLAELTAVLKAQAGSADGVDDLTTAALHWLFERKIVIPGDRAVRDLARAAFAHIETCAIQAARSALSVTQQKKCRHTVFGKRTGNVTVLEWLKIPPRKASPSTLDTTLEKIAFLKELKVHEWKLEAIPLARQKVYAHAVASRPPSDTKSVSDAVQLLEVVCFLRIALLELTDSALFQTGRRVASLVRDASGKTTARQALRSGDYRVCLVSIKDVLNDTKHSAEERLASIADLIASMGDLAPSSHAALVREALSQDPARVHNLIDAVSDLDFRGRKNEPALRQLQTLRRLRAAGLNELPIRTKVPVDRVWKDAIKAADRRRAFKALEACTAQSLRRGLKRGSVWVDHSMTYRERDQMLIPMDEWQRDKATHLSALGLPEDVEKFLDPLLELVEVNLKALAEAKEAGDFTIDNQGVLHLPELGAIPEESEPERLRERIFKMIGDVQFPDLILEVDALTNFSEALLGRRARDENELVAVYAALIAHGTEIDAKSVAAMTPQLDPGHVSAAMRALESPARMNLAIRRVVEFQKKHRITELWGGGSLASSDMMSIDATRNLWNARTDPRRRTYAVGVYTHVMDHHGIVYHQPVVLNERQAGPALAGVVQHNRNTKGNRLTRLAVDTHGYTYAGMAFAKLLGFDLCPQLRDLDERKLFLLRSMDTPPGLEQVVITDLSLAALRENWDEMLRMAASILSGRVSANVLLQRMGSAAQGDPLYKAFDQLGRLLRTIYLADYFANKEFRREIHTVLNRGESVHQLQRTIFTGKIAPSRGRRRDELVAISGSHALLTNLVIAWNTHHMQQVIDRLRKAGQSADDEWVKRMGPAHSSPTSTSAGSSVSGLTDTVTA